VKDVCATSAAADRTDLIHVKAMLLEIPNYEAVLERLTVYLQPGGLLVVVEGSVSYVGTYHFS